MKSIALTFVAVLLIMGVQTPATQKPCREHPKLSGACFRVRGRMNYWNGSPTLRIWIVGTRRMLGVSDSRFIEPGYHTVPPGLLRKLSWDSDLFADFIVCPFTERRAGEMQLVCVDQATNVTSRSRDGPRQN